MKNERTKVLFISDHPLIPSGVGSQAKNLIEGLLETEKYRFFCFGGAIKHPNYTPQHVAPEKFGEGNWIILPVDGHGNKDLLRKVLYQERPDAVVMFTDPRFFYWIWEMEDEVRSVCPLLYWHVWDNDPTPDFNRVFYESTDFISCLSLKTYGLLQDLKHPQHRFNYIPHAVHPELFKPLSEHEIVDFKRRHYGPHADKEFIVMWNNRNARRKMTGDVVEAFARFAKTVGHDKTALFMHTQAFDPEGQDILSVAAKLGVDKNVIMSEERLDASVINYFYNVADVTINIASNEGFGLGTLESLSAGTPIVVHFTGGLQFQIGDWWEGLTDFTNQDKMTERAKRRWCSKAGNWWGVPVFPAVRNCVGSQQVPYIYDDRACPIETAQALQAVYDLGRRRRKEIGLKAREWVKSKFNLNEMVSTWDRTIGSEIERHGSSSFSFRTASV